MRKLSSRSLLIDAAIAGAVLAAALGAISHGGFDESDKGLDVVGGVLAALTALPLAARRLAPLPVFALVTAATATLYGLRYGLGPPIGFAIALYTVAEQPEVERPRLRLGFLVASIVVLLAPHLIRDGFAPELLLGAVVWLAAWFAGDRSRLRQERIAELEERAQRAEREAERERRLAAAEERMRIARDLHDSAGHAISVILVQAGAARLLQERDPAGARAALETVEEVARDTLGEIDQLVRALREDLPAGEVEPPPGLAALDALAERYRGSGLAVTVTVDGSRRTLSPAVDQAAFVSASLEIAVTNRAEAGEAAPDRGGHGIVGMRERAQLLGGTLEAGADNGSFRVHAQLPYEGGL